MYNVRMRSNRADEPRLWNMWLTIALVVAFAASLLAGAVAVVWLTLANLKAPTGQSLSAADQLSIIRIALLFTGGLGGLVALVVAYRRQRLAENSNWRAVLADRQENYKLFNELYISTSGMLGNETAAVRQAGIYAVARLADDWPRFRQSCVDVLCAYLRTPADDGAQLSAAERQVRLSAVRIISAHLDSLGEQSWQDCVMDFSGAELDGQLLEDLIGQGDRAPGSVATGE